MKAFNQYHAEAKEKWGNTQAYKEYEAKHSSPQKWDALSAGLDHIMADFAACMRQEQGHDSPEAQLLVKTLQDYITENYYHCTKEILAGLGQMYVTDVRFQSNIDRHGDGTATFISKAITVYCNK